MKRVSIKDTRVIVENDFNFSQIDPASITQEDINRLVVKMAIQMGVINRRTFRTIENDPLISDAEKAALLKV